LTADAEVDSLKQAFPAEIINNVEYPESAAIY